MNDYLLTIEGYCRNSDCISREVTIRVKDYDRTLKGQPPAAMMCPLCHGPLSLHWMKSTHEVWKKDQEHARQSVNLQMRVRDKGPTTELIGFSLSAMTDDRLPPTPEGWWARG